MEKVKYSGECELKTRTAYQQGCFFPTMLRIQEVCCERNTDGHYPVRCFTHYDYFIMDESTSLVSTLNVNNQSGVRYYSNVINATWVRMRPEKHLELMALANEKLIVIAQDNNDEYWVLTNVNATAETAQSGQASDDLSGYQVELTGRSPKLPYSISQANLPAIDTPEVYED